MSILSSTNIGKIKEVREYAEKYFPNADYCVEPYKDSYIVSIKSANDWFGVHIDAKKFPCYIRANDNYNLRASFFTENDLYKIVLTKPNIINKITFHNSTIKNPEKFGIKYFNFVECKIYIPIKCLKSLYSSSDIKLKINNTHIRIPNIVYDLNNDNNILFEISKQAANALQSSSTKNIIEEYDGKYYLNFGEKQIRMHLKFQSM